MAGAEWECSLCVSGSRGVAEVCEAHIRYPDLAVLAHLSLFSSTVESSVDRVSASIARPTSICLPTDTIPEA